MGAKDRLSQIKSHLSKNSAPPPPTIAPPPRAPAPTPAAAPSPPSPPSSRASSSSSMSSSYAAGLLQGKVAIVTGAGQGIGASTALLFGREGARVVVADIDGAKAEEVAASIRDEGGEAVAVVCDVLQLAQVESLVEKAAAFGEGKIHIIVNNAGFTWDGVVHKMTDKQWDTILALHTKAPFWMVRAAAKYFRVRDSEDRSIINISSTSGLHGNAGQANYAVAKMGIIGLTKTLAKEWGPQFGVRANTVAFGSVSTRLTAAKEAGAAIEVDGERVALGIPSAQQKGNEGHVMIPLRRAATPDEAAGSVLALASPLCSYVSGHTLEVTGGLGI